MADDKLFELVTKMYSEIIEMKNDISSLKEGQLGLKDSISKVGAKIDGEINDKLKVLMDEQAIIRKDAMDIKYQQRADKEVLLDIKLGVDTLNSNQKNQENKIIEIDRKIAK